MSRIWRWLAPVAVAGGLIAASGAVPAQAASPTAYSITIYAKTAYPKVTHDSLVIYLRTKYDTAAIHGQIKGTTAGDVATLLSEPFGAKHFRATGNPITLAGGAPQYSFRVQPSVATKYEVQVMTGTRFDVRSSVQTVYVALAGQEKGARERCGHTSCTYTVNVYTQVPTSTAYRIESAKHVYMYLAVGYPRVPADYTLSARSTASRPRRVRSGEFEMTVTWYIPLRNGTARWLQTFCTKDSVTRDGIGLPGSHGCGVTKVNVRQANLYLG